jgi:hypothetical protein
MGENRGLGKEIPGIVIREERGFLEGGRAGDMRIRDWEKILL